MTSQTYLQRQLMPPKSEATALKIVAYCHGATAAEIASQIDAAQEFARAHHGPITFYREIRRIGKDPGPAYDQALAAARGIGVTLLFATMGDLAQKTSFLKSLSDSGLPFHVLDDELANRGTLPLMLRLARDHELRSSTIKASLARKRAELQALNEAERTRLAAQGRRVKLGGNPIDDAGRKESAHVRRTAADARLEIVTSEIVQLMAEGILDNAEIAEKLNEKGLSRPRGGGWTGIYVSRITARLKSKPRRLG